MLLGDVFHADGGMPPFQQWADRGLTPRCVDADPAAFFPDKGGDPQPARQLCRGCDVLDECREWALDTNQQFGIWGATTENDRKQLRRRWAA